MTVACARPSILVLAGATAVGKTRLAIELCQRLGGEIIGADSIQVYRGFDLGSGKPSAAELGGVAHHLIDVLDPGEEIDAARYARLADAAIADVVARDAVPIVVGGTGLWLRALLRGLVDLPPVDPALRAALEGEFHSLGGVALHARLGRVDPETAARVHANDMIRVVRALEVHAQTGQALGALRLAHALGSPRYRALTLVLDMPRAQWLTALDARVRGMFDAGWIEEVRSLMAQHGSEIKPLRSVGYRQVAEGVRRAAPRDVIEREVLQATRLYGKRQRTWFQSDPSVDRRVQIGELSSDEMLAAISRHLHPQA